MRPTAQARFCEIDRFALPVIALLALTPSPALARTVILHPLDGFVTAQAGGVAVGFCSDPEVDSLDIQLNGKVHRVEVWEGVFEIDLDWAKGRNLLTAGGRTIGFTYDPYADRAAVHEATLTNCTDCHVLGENRDLRLRDQQTRFCVRCHPAGQNGLRHGSATCADCHAAHAAHGEGRPHRVRAAGDALCNTCHGGKPGILNASAHGSIASGPGCGACHRPHSPSARDQAVCEGCHGEHKSGVDTHMDVACANCHWMHRDAAAARYKEPAASCANCHGIPADAGHASVVVQCTPCHNFHRPTGKARLNAALCAACHSMRTGESHGGDQKIMVDCSNCHLVHNPRDLSHTAADCGRCHSEETVLARHPRPVTPKSNCLACHKVHGNDQKSLLARVQHEPFRSRNCEACHGHGSPRPGHDSSWEPLCTACHRDTPGPFTHAPAREGKCQACHAAHGGAAAGQLLKPVNELCRSCHPDKLGPNGILHRSAMTCSACHDPHGGGRDRDLRADEGSLCASCHPHAMRTADGSPTRFVHGPIEAEGCSVCHDVHAARLIAPRDELCSACHEEQRPTAKLHGSMQP